MRLDLFPLEAETDEGLFTRLAEECSEVIKAVCKIQRFGLGAHPAAPPGTHNLNDLVRETEDVELCIAELKRRLTP